MMEQLQSIYSERGIRLISGLSPSPVCVTIYSDRDTVLLVTAAAMDNGIIDAIRLVKGGATE